MDIQFQDENLGAYFNEKYINVRIDMDGPYGQALREKYDVFFLPTILILDKHGNPKYVSEGLLSSDELLSIGSYHHNAIYNPAALMNSSVSSDIAQHKARKEVITDPFGQKGTFENPFESTKPAAQPEIIPEQNKEVKTDEVVKETMPVDEDDDLLPEEKILYTANDQSKNPDYLYNYTYLKLQLQDNTHWAIADQYLATQEDWATDKNMRFIFDFVRSTKSDKFQHIIDNREKYNELIGEELVNQAIDIMVNMALYQAFPRPTKEESFKLFSLLNVDDPYFETLNYILTRYEKQQDYHEYVETALEYVVKYNSSDYVLIEKIAMFYEDSNVDTPIEEVIELTKNAIANQGGTRHQLYDALANLYFQNKNKRKALNTIKKAKELAILNNADTFSIDNLHNRIKAL